MKTLPAALLATLALLGAGATYALAHATDPADAREDAREKRGDESCPHANATAERHANESSRVRDCDESDDHDQDANDRGADRACERADENARFERGANEPSRENRTAEKAETDNETQEEQCETHFAPTAAGHDGDRDDAARHAAEPAAQPHGDAKGHDSD
jgi:hypothetical protein